MPTPSDCVVLVPVGSSIDPGCEAALRELETRGYPVWRVRDYSAVDAARNQMASDALGQGFAELMWIDSDIVFEPDAVERLRSHNLVRRANHSNASFGTLACPGGGSLRLQFQLPISL